MKKKLLASKNIINTVAGLLLFIVTIAMSYMVHVRVPFMMDDFWYMTKLDSEETIHSFGDIIHAQAWHYNNWGGRSITHGLLQIILMQGETFANICNVLAEIVTGIVIMLFMNLGGARKTSMGEKLISVSLITGGLHGLNPNWKMSMYWQSGAANYLYITIPILLFIYCYIRELRSDSEATLPGIIVWIFPLGFITGWSNENMGPTAFLIALFVLFFAVKKKRFKAWMLLGAISSLAGSAICILAPGNRVRTAQIDAESYGLLWKLYLRTYGVFKGYLEFLFPAILVTAFVVLVIVFVRGRYPKAEESVLILAGIISTGAMLLSPHFPDRAAYGSMVLLMTASLIMWRRECIENGKSIWVAYMAGGLIWLRGMFYLAEFAGLSLGWIR